MAECCTLYLFKTERSLEELLRELSEVCKLVLGLRHVSAQDPQTCKQKFVFCSLQFCLEAAWWFWFIGENVTFTVSLFLYLAPKKVVAMCLGMHAFHPWATKSIRCFSHIRAGVISRCWINLAAWAIHCCTSAEPVSETLIRIDWTDFKRPWIFSSGLIPTNRNSCRLPSQNLLTSGNLRNISAHLGSRCCVFLILSHDLHIPNRVLYHKGLVYVCATWLHQTIASKPHCCFVGM